MTEMLDNENIENLPLVKEKKKSSNKKVDTVKKTTVKPKKTTSKAKK